MATGRARGPGIAFGDSPFNGYTAPRKAGQYVEPIMAPSTSQWAQANEIDQYLLTQQAVDHPHEGRGHAPRICDDH